MLLSRLLIFGGKGGVGKSTLACATALRLAEKGRTLIVSLDPAHSLSDILCVKIEREPTNIWKNLWAVELDALYLSKEYTKKVFENVKTLLSPKAQEGFLKMADVVSQSNTSLETASLDKVIDYFEEYSYVVLDFAPTGNMTRFFSSVDLLEEWMNLLIALAKKQEKVEKFMGREYPLLDLLRERLRKVTIFKQVLKERSIMYAIANEEPLSIKEANALKERFRNLQIYIVINRSTSKDLEGLKIPFKENLYGIEALRDLDITQIMLTL